MRQANAPSWQRCFEKAETPKALHWWTLRFPSNDLNRAFDDWHWDQNMSFWLWFMVFFGLIFDIVSLVFPEFRDAVFDLRVDSNLSPRPALQATWSEEDKGFLIWHAAFGLAFLVVLTVDAFRRYSDKSSSCWTSSRMWITNFLIVIDLVLSSFLNPAFARFMMLFYALLVRTDFVQTVFNVLLFSIAIFVAGAKVDHQALAMVSIAEFLVYNILAILSSRQTTVYTKFAWYFYDYIMKTDYPERGTNASATFQGAVSPNSMARDLLSLSELKVRTAPEDSLDAAERGTAAAPGQVAPTTSQDASQQQPTVSDPAVTGAASERDRAATDGSSPNANEECTENEDLADEVHSTRSHLSAAGLPPFVMEEGTINFRQTSSNDWPSTNEANTWGNVEDAGARFKVRGKTYLTDKVKQSATPCKFTVHQVVLLKTVNPLLNVGTRLASLSKFMKDHPDRFFFIYNRVVPYKEDTIMNVVNIMVRNQDDDEGPEFANIFGKFVQQDEGFRNLRLKHLCTFREAPWIVTSAISWMGGEKPVIIGKGFMDQRHYQGANWIEVDVDISTSRTAKMTVGKVIDNGTAVVMEEMIVIEGQSAEELPERPIASWRWNHINCDASMTLLDESLLLPEHPTQPETQTLTL